MTEISETWSSVFGLRGDGTQRCCGATNPHCDRYVEPNDYCGCANCGHSFGCHVR